MNQSQAEIVEEQSRLQVEQEELRARLEGASAAERPDIEARIQAIERQRSALLQKILHGGVDFGGE
jgi:regulator of replication initiation timing